MITLVTLPPAFGLRNVSPFCLKIEMALTHLGLKFDHETEQDPRKAPKGKLPYLIIDGEKISDSELIFERLNTMTQGKLYAGLTPEEKATGVAFSRLAEDHLYWMGVASRWLDDKWYPNIVDGFFGFVPGLLRGFASNGARKAVAKTYDLHGLGRHTFEEQKGFAKRDLEAIADIVGTKNYIVGGRLTAFDFVIAGMLSGFMDNKPATWLGDIANGYPDLREYLQRIQTEVGVSGK
ncbi:MAG: glutathione S-transferase family protein [Gammaproteobacteria bacterium]|jgi:glutathione S-transferase|nr:glutathione S-transferase family protein [Gammaproteobacteria bacterium]MBT5154180.1 glutathione S-transferase family protein [Gammaproteobacteria bacterium]MBT5686475.1 glutathione S-transferase family protein [Gammaproteobacteria bacterium]MBT5725495.1 glutathione S-transferase family protein [Gammaproteobacteria bacterium]MBT6585516.1 glutathione S-transferase family protein [Gammaproteobacteria bacterium]